MKIKSLVLLALVICMLAFSFASCDTLGEVAGKLPFEVPFLHTHEFSEATCTTPATCECGATEGELGGHQNVPLYGIGATCTETGLTKGSKCAICGTVTKAQNEVAKAPHTEVTVPGKAATCTEAGLTNGAKCFYCGIVTLEQETIPATGHTFTEGKCACGAEDPDYIAPITIAEAIAAEDGTTVTVLATIVEINTAYSEQYDNITVTVKDSTGSLYCYRLTGNWAVGDILVITGTKTTYNGNIQLAQGATAKKVGTHECTDFTTATCTLASVCVLCNNIAAPALGHNFESGTCTTCGEPENTTPVVNYVLKAVTEDGTAWYWTGAVSSGKGALTTDASEAALINMETTDDGVYLCITEASGAKKYLAIGTTNTSLSLNDTATALTYDEANGYISAGEGEDARYLATYKTQDLRTYKASNIPGTGAEPNIYMVLTIVE